MGEKGSDDKRMVDYRLAGDFVSAMVKAGMTPDMMRKVVASCGNRKARAMVVELTDLLETYGKFELFSTFNIIVPEDYDPAACIDGFRNRHADGFFGKGFTDANFSAAARILLPGQVFGCEVYQIEGSATLEECLLFLKKRGAWLLGGQVMTFIYDQGHYDRAACRRVVSICTRNVDGDLDHRYISLYRNDAGYPDFGVYECNHFDGEYCHLLCFVPLNAEQSAG